MELDMKKDIKSTDKISKGTLHEILLDIKYRLDHLEDIEADNRALIVKMIKQGNTIVKFLANIDIDSEEVEKEIDIKFKPDIDISDMNSENKLRFKELLDEFMDKREGLKELEEELEKYKDEITPGQIGDA
jgi:hypothetical protein